MSPLSHRRRRRSSDNALSPHQRQQPQQLLKERNEETTAHELAAAAARLIMPVGLSSQGEEAAAAATTTTPSSQWTCESLLGQTASSLDDAIDALALSHKLTEEDAHVVNPPLKFTYECPSGFSTLFSAPQGDQQESAGISQSEKKERQHSKSGFREAELPVRCSSDSQNTPAYDWLFALGCLNCGKPLSLAADLLPSVEAALTQRQKQQQKPSLICSACGHRVAPLHNANEPESLQEAGALDELFCDSATTSSSIASSSSSKTEDFDEIYLFGMRQQMMLGKSGKRFWKERFLGSSFQEQQLQQQLRLVEAVGKEKHGVICKETCERCGNGDAFFFSFQARSADEGMTVMYECTKCAHRRVVNT